MVHTLSCRAQCGSSVVHPRRYPTSTYSRSESEPLTAHGKVTDEIPYQRDELDDGRDQGQERRVKLGEQLLAVLLTISKSDLHTPTAKYIVMKIEPKYAAVNGRRGPETK